ncbi:hypothetical protein [Halococcus thailandensis]|nr:hypothetical protein [Halococcus thailandensis]
MPAPRRNYTEVNGTGEIGEQIDDSSSLVGPEFINPVVDSDGNRGCHR